MGYNRTWLIELRYERRHFMELQLKNLEVETLVKQIRCLTNLLLKPKSSDNINIMISLFQHVSEITHSILDFKL